MSLRARRFGRDLLEESRVTSDPTLRTVFTADAVSVAGDVLALAALALNQITGSSIPQAVAAVLIALVMIRLSLRLIQRSHDFLTGAWTGHGLAASSARASASPARCGGSRLPGRSAGTGPAGHNLPRPRQRGSR